MKEKLFNEALGKISEIAEKVSLHEIKFAEAEKQTKTICQDFPGLCERIDVLEKKISLAKPPADKPKEKLLGTDHETIEEILSCPSCLLDHLKKVGLDKASSELCGSDEACQAIVVELVKKGFKVGPPTKDKENVTAETKKGSHFSLGRSQG
ncbi:MAG: hypothetical protein L6254_04985 [Candidatus Omnitrophica bacterium]|nr:hypothetical protein [Candidatus Omnitrophota bacterium]